MRKALLDTNFMLTCLSQKIDFFRYLGEEGISAIIPSKVIRELEGISKNKSKRALNAKLALKVLMINNFQTLDIKGKTVDKSLINYTRENPQIIIATLDREIQKRLKNKKLIIRGKKQLEVI